MGEAVTHEIFRRGVFLADKPQGPTSHQVSAWVRDLAGAERAGHAGTLDPRVTGVLPIAFNEATRALDAMLVADKEYVGVLELHQDVPDDKLHAMFRRFVGPIYQMPPVRSAVKRELRVRTIHELELLERASRLVLFRARCESGTYIRTLANDIGEALGVGGHLADLRRTRAGPFSESQTHPLTELQDAIVFWREDGDDANLRKLILPMERLLDHLPKIVVKDTAADAICHGANLHVPGVVSMAPGIGKGTLVALLTAKGEGVAIAHAMMTARQVESSKKGVAADTKRVLMEPGTYPKGWRS
ncbi:MAG TPA: RNA-guided pseudouridylation complex pseudouridine synthase subunit Cbf5 [Thermoplasmata archaeon]|nr:RNA-guided pseudouridylation complex pseudouridine synthase subunit Cbf5 [Thermoplasmata archaeon]